MCLATYYTRDTSVLKLCELKMNNLYNNTLFTYDKQTVNSYALIPCSQIVCQFGEKRVLSELSVTNKALIFTVTVTLKRNLNLYALFNTCFKVIS